MEWLASNWIWIVFALGFLALHMFGHGGHGHGRGHGDHGRNRRGSEAAREGAEQPVAVDATPHAAHGDTRSAPEGQRHRHGC